MPKFTIITPTLLRPFLVDTCVSVDSQEFKDWEHFVVVDTLVPPTIIRNLSRTRRHFLFCNEIHADFGNTCRANAWDHATGDYLVYIDDDDVFAPDALRLLSDAIDQCPEPPIWGTFPILFLGEVRHKLPPGTGNTMNQIFHRKVWDGYQLRWPTVKIYSGDGLMADMLGAIAPHTTINTEPLVIVEGVGGGWPRFEKVKLD